MPQWIFLFSVTPHLGMESVTTPHLDEGLLGNWDQPLLILPTGKWCTYKHILWTVYWDLVRLTSAWQLMYITIISCTARRILSVLQWWKLMMVIHRSVYIAYVCTYVNPSYIMREHHYCNSRGRNCNHFPRLYSQYDNSYLTTQNMAINHTVKVWMWMWEIAYDKPSYSRLIVRKCNFVT